MTTTCLGEYSIFFFFSLVFLEGYKEKYQHQVETNEKEIY